uniref:Coat protein n=1 Tax=Jasmine virus A associated satellite virus TaxID=3080343 RepID=A0AA96WM09_9VIRU|nr:coat protein [Jasmine virus A associated satellite virus]
MVGRRRNRGAGRRARRRVPAIPSLNYATAKTGSTTTLCRKDFQIVAGCGDRSFKIVGLSLQVASFSEPFLVQTHIYNPEGKEIGLGQQFVTENRRKINLRLPNNFKGWWDGNTGQTTNLVSVVLLPLYKGQAVNVSFLITALFRFGQPELSGRT